MNASKNPIHRLSRRDLLKSSAVGGMTFAAAGFSQAVADNQGQRENEKDRPNILWVIAEDMSCHFGYQGQPLVHTPHVDRLAREGVAFSNAYVSSPVCSPSRSALITGMYQTSIGVQHHYTGRGTVKHHLPAHVRLIPELFK